MSENRSPDQAEESKRGSLMVDDSVKIRDFALEKAGDAKVKKGLNFRDMAATLNIKDQMGEAKVEGKMGSVGIEVKLPAMDKAGDYKLENKTYNPNDKNTTDTMDIPSAAKVKPASVGRLGNKTYDPNHKDMAEAMGKSSTVHIKDKTDAMGNLSAVNAKAQKSATDKIVAMNVKDKAGAMDKKVDTKTKDKKLAVADKDESDDYLKDCWLFDMEDIICKYT
jgi:hypothetical protein